jgi:dipeptidyl aminopeptidase/acylaminoacyl peptidase
MVSGSGASAGRRLSRRSWLLMLLVTIAGAESETAFAHTGVRDLVEVTDLSGLGASPDGRYVVFRTERADIERNGYELRWHAVEASTGKVREIGSGGLPIYADPGSIQEAKPLWLPNGDAIVFPALIDGAVGVWKATLDGSSVVPLIVRDEDVETVSLSPDGQALLYKVGPSREEIRRAEHKEYDSGILVDSSVDLAQNLFRGGSINGRMATQRLVGYWYVRSGLLWRSPRQQRRYELLTQTDLPVGQPEPVPPFQPPPLTAAASVRSEAGDLAEATWDGESGSITAHLNGSPARLSCQAALCATGRVSALAWRPGTKELVVTFRDRHRRQSLYLWDVMSGELRLVVQSDGLLSGDRRGMVPCTVTTSTAFCVAASAASPPRLERIDLDSGARTVLFDPNAALRSAYSPGVEHLTWKTSSRTTAAGTLLTPGGIEVHSAPLFINYYACDGFLRGGEGDEWPIPSLLEVGFVVACVNAVPIKGPQDGVANYRMGLDAVASLITLLDQRGLIDRGKVAMGGFSFGSEVAMWTAMNSKLLTALSIASAQSEPGKYWMSSMPGSDQAKLIRAAWGLGQPEKTPSRWKLVSPALNTERIRVPILFQLPEQEARMIPELYARLNLAAVPTELHAFPDEAHIKGQPRHRVAVYERNLDWFRYWLQDYRDPDTAKSDQYRRWDALNARWRPTEQSTTP